MRSSRPIRPLFPVALIAVVAALLATAFAETSTSAAPKPTNPNAGIVDVFTTLGYEHGLAAGTGVVVSPSGEVVTNNHVIRGATTFRVVDVTTHRSYSATVVGYSVPADVAVLKLANASGLQTIPLGNSATVKVGQQVVARGNAGGAGGLPKVAAGKILRLHQQIIAQDSVSFDSETLTNLIETDAQVQPGDSGGPLLNASGRAIGIVTAGSVGFRFQSGGGVGYAIPINTVLSVARQIEAGQGSSAIHVGPTAFLGVDILDAAGGVQVQGVVPGSAAEAAGLTAGDVITSLAGNPVDSTSTLQKAVLALAPGSQVPIAWTDQFGTAQTGQITPASGPPQ